MATVAYRVRLVLSAAHRKTEYSFASSFAPRIISACRVAHFTADQLIAALQPLALDGHIASCAHGVSTDTRTIEPGMLFVALRGERYDGHAFVQEAVARGACGLILDGSLRGQIPPQPVPIVWVRDTLVALGDLGRYHRRRFPIPVVGIAGSAGKTTTKDMTAHILAASGPVHRTPGNWNNLVGVPLTLLGIQPHHTAAVIELGTNHPGEIEQLCTIAEPTHGLITTIAEEHLEFFHSLDGVEQEETALFRWLAACGGSACVNLDDGRLARYAAELPSVVTFGASAEAMLQASFHFEAETLFPILTLQWNGTRVQARIQQPGFAVARCGIAAAAAAISVGMHVETVAAQLESYRPSSSHGYARMVVNTTNSGIIILNDCYNANPASMRCALETLAVYPTQGQRIAVLGDMRELGAASNAAHVEILGHAREHADVVIVLGEDMHRAAEALGGNGILRADDHSAAAALVQHLARPGDVVLVKGSRSLALEQVIALLDVR